MEKNEMDEQKKLTNKQRCARYREAHRERIRELWRAYYWKDPEGYNRKRKEKREKKKQEKQEFMRQLRKLAGKGDAA